MSHTTLRNAGVGVVMLAAIAACSIAQAAGRQTPAHGVYSNMEAVDGELSGFEFIIIPSDEGVFVVAQVAEGSPQKPLLLPARLEGSPRSSDNNAIQFDHPDWGPFRGVILGDSLVGEFTRAKHTITLRRGQSIWQ